MRYLLQTSCMWIHRNLKIYTCFCRKAISPKKINCVAKYYILLHRLLHTEDAIPTEPTDVGDSKHRQWKHPLMMTAVSVSKATQVLRICTVKLYWAFGMLGTLELNYDHPQHRAQYALYSQLLYVIICDVALLLTSFMRTYTYTCINRPHNRRVIYWNKNRNTTHLRSRQMCAIYRQYDTTEEHHRGGHHHLDQAMQKSGKLIRKLIRYKQAQYYPFVTYCRMRLF